LQVRKLHPVVDPIDHLVSLVRYLIGVHNKRTKVTTLRAAPLHVITRQVKALKGLESEEPSALQFIGARGALREAFGTKKAQALLRAEERNRVDVSAMEDVAGHLQERIELNTGALPTKGERTSLLWVAALMANFSPSPEEAEATADSNRLIPPYNAGALEPADVYSLHDIIPEAEWKALSISALMNASNDRMRVAALPYCRSEWVNQHLTRAFASDPPSKKKL
jgi:DNA-directed RNA polymerase I subunit RPA49